MLMDHANAQGNRIVRGLDVHPLAANINFAFIRPVEAHQHVHQRRFARTIFAQKRKYFAFAHRQIHIRIGHDVAKRLCKSFQLDRGRGCVLHAQSLPFFLHFPL